MSTAMPTHGADSPRIEPDAPTLWVGLDAFGARVISGYLEPALRAAPERGHGHSCLTAATLDDGLRSTILEAIGARLETLGGARAWGGLDPAVPRERRTAGRASRRFAVVHLWLIYDLDADIADAVPGWLAESLAFFDTIPVQLRVHLLTTCTTWARDTAPLRARLAQLQDQVLAPGAPGHSRVMVFLATDRDYLAYKLGQDDCLAAAGHFAAMMLLTDAPRAHSQAISRLFVPPALAADLAHARPAVASNGPPGEPTAARAPQPEQPNGVAKPGAAASVGGDVRNGHAPDPIVWGPFAALSVRALVYPAQAIWAARQAERHAVLTEALAEEPPPQWSPAVPPIPDIDLEVAAAFDGFTPREVPLWRPNLRQSAQSEIDSVVDTIDHWAKEATFWQREEERRFASRWQRIVAAPDRMVDLYRASFNRYVGLLLNEPHNGFVPLLERYLANCQSVVQKEIEGRRQRGEAGDDNRGTVATIDLAQPPVPPAVDGPETVLRPVGRLGGRGEGPQQAIARAIATRVKLIQFLWIAIVSAIVTIYFIHQALVNLPSSLLGAYPDLAARNPVLPRVDAGWTQDGLTIDSVTLYWIVAAVVAAATLVLLMRTWQRTFRRLTTIYTRRFFDPAVVWTQEKVIDRYRKELGQYVGQPAWTMLHEILALLEAERARLDALKRLLRDAPQPSPWQPPDRLTVRLSLPAGDPVLTREAARDIVRAFRRFTEEGAGWAIVPDQRDGTHPVTPEHFFAALHHFAAHQLRDPEPGLARDLGRCLETDDDIAALLPMPEDVFALPVVGPPRVAPWVVVQALAVPDYLVEHRVIREAECPVLTMPVELPSGPSEERLYAVAIRYGMSAGDLFAQHAARREPRRATVRGATR